MTAVQDAVPGPPDPGQVATEPGIVAVLALERCMFRGDLAGAEQLLRSPRIAAGLAVLTAPVRNAEQLAGWRVAAAQFAAEHAEALRRQQERMLDDALELIARALGLPDGPVCRECMRVLGRRRNCPYCKAEDARWWPPWSEKRPPAPDSGHGVPGTLGYAILP